jgi:hypothetical protein
VQTPVFVNCRDRLTPLKELVAWLERAGHDEIYLIDNDSAYEALLDWYEQTPHTVIRLGENYGKWSLWQAPGVFELTRDRYFVYTDPDVVPTQTCPLDALDRFHELLGRYQLPNKVGFGLRIDDIPATYRHRDAVIAVERAMYDWPLENGAFWFPIDTTFALYRPNAGWGREAIRTGPPYLARHDSWYIDLARPTDEEAFYAARAANETAHTSGMAHWTRDELDAHHSRAAAEAEHRRPSLATRLRWRVRGRRAVRHGRRTQAAAV